MHEPDLQLRWRWRSSARTDVSPRARSRRRQRLHGETKNHLLTKSVRGHLRPLNIVAVRSVTNPLAFHPEVSMRDFKRKAVIFSKVASAEG
jgi:hypothetical protein